MVRIRFSGLALDAAEVCAQVIQHPVGILVGRPHGADVPGRPPRWCGVLRPIRYINGLLMQMTSSTASSTIGQPHRAAQYGRYPLAQM